MPDWTDYVTYSEPQEQHVFGGTSDLCLYCGCGYGWFNRNVGKPCPDRAEYLKKTLVSSIATGESRMRRVKPIVKARALRISTGRRFR